MEKQNNITKNVYLQCFFLVCYVLKRQNACKVRYMGKEMILEVLGTKTLKQVISTLYGEKEQHYLERLFCMSFFYIVK